MHRSSTEASPGTALSGHGQQAFTIALLHFSDQNCHEMLVLIPLYKGSTTVIFSGSAAGIWPKLPDFPAKTAFPVGLLKLE
jgi:hypothetical protein